MTKKSKSTKTRSKKYDNKLAINGSFEDVIKVSVKPIKPTLFADFNSEITENRITFTNGTSADIKRLGIELRSGVEIVLDDGDELRAEGIIEFLEEQKTWVMKYDPKTLKNYSRD
jgi:hypothetical protein